jgi:hypothetical protein
VSDKYLDMEPLASLTKLLCGVDVVNAEMSDILEERLEASVMQFANDPAHWKNGYTLIEVYQAMTGAHCEWPDYPHTNVYDIIEETLFPGNGFGLRWYRTEGEKEHHGIKFPVWEYGGLPTEGEDLTSMSGCLERPY